MNLFSRILRQCGSNILLAFLLSTFLIFPDILYHWLSKTDSFGGKSSEILLAFLLCFSMTWIRHTWIFLCIWLSLLFLSSCHLLHLAYFGSPITGVSFLKIFSDSEDVFRFSYLKQVGLPFFILCLSYGTGIILWKRFKKHLSSSSIGAFFFSALTIFSFHKALRDAHFVNHQDVNAWVGHRGFSFVCGVSALKNSIKISMGPSLSLSFPKEPLIPNESKTQTIILIMGEGCHPGHMSLYGYSRKTTPHLDSLNRDPSFFFGKAITNATRTFESITLFHNLIKEPGNLEPMITESMALFKKAKENGFHTYLLSCSLGKSPWGSGTMYQVHKKERPEYRDEMEFFKEELSKIPFNERNFIVLHMLAPHPPFQDHYKEHPEFRIYPEGESSYNSYDNAITYVDTIIHEVLRIFKEKAHGEGYVFFISDHSIHLGSTDQNNHALWGNGHLSPECATVPFWMYSLHPDPTFFKSVQSSAQPLSAYEVGRFILDRIGYTISSTVPSRFYVHNAVSNSPDNLYLEWTRETGGATFKGPYKLSEFKSQKRQ